MRWAGRLLLLVAALAVAAVAALAVGARYVDPVRLVSLVSQRVRAATGLEFTVAGDLRVRVFPRIAVVAEGVRLSHGQGSPRPDPLRIRRLEGSLSLLPLLARQIRIDRLLLVEPEFVVESAKPDSRGAPEKAPGAPPEPAFRPGGVLPLTMTLQDVTFAGGSVVRRDAASGKELRLAIDRLTLRRPAGATRNAVDFAGSLDGRPVTLTGEVGPLEAFLIGGNPLDVDVTLKADPMGGTFAGKIDRSGEGRLIEGTVKLNVAGTPRRAPQTGEPGASPAPLELSGNLTLEKGILRLERLQIAHGPSSGSGHIALRLDTPGLELTGALGVALRDAQNGRELRVGIDRFSLSAAATSGSSTLDAAISVQGQLLTLKGTTGSLEGLLAGRDPIPLDLALATEGASASVKGSIDRGAGAVRPDVTVKINITGTSSVEKMAGGTLPLPIPLNLTGHLSRKDRAWRVDDLEIVSARSRVSGNLRFRKDTPQTELTATLTATWNAGDGGEEVRLSLDALILKRGISPAEDALDVAGSLRGQPFTLAGRVGAVEKFLGGRAPLPLDLAFATEGAKVTFKGRLVRGAGEVSPDVHVKARVEGTAALAKLAGTPLAIPVPLDAAGRLTVREKTWRIEALDLASGQSRATGNLTVRVASPRPEVNGTIDAPFINVPELAGWQNDDDRARATPGRRLFSDVPLPFDALRRFDGRLKLTAARMTLATWLQLGSVSLDFDLREGVLKIDPARFLIADGAVAGTAQVIAAPQRTPRVSLTLAGGGISLERYAADLGYPQSVAGGTAELSIRLSGGGTSVRAITSALEGEFRLSCGPARLTTLAMAPGDILSGVFETINPFRSKDNFTDLTCAVVRLPVRSGLVTIDRTVAYETRKVATAVAGTINLGSEAIDLAMRPTVKSGFGLVGAPGKAEFVRITGTLAKPKIELSTLATARTALSAGGAIATAGLSLIGEALFKKAAADYHPCRTALERNVLARGARE